MRRVFVSLSALLLLATACGDDSASAADWCDFAQEVEDQLDTAADNQDPGGYRQAAQLIEDARDSAPPEIREAVDTSAEGFNAIVEALDANDDNLLAAFDDVSAELDLDELSAAGDQIEAFNEAECGIGADDDGDSDSDSGDSDSGDSDSGDSDGGFDPDANGTLSQQLAEELGISDEQAGA